MFLWSPYKCTPSQVILFLKSTSDEIDDITYFSSKFKTRYVGIGGKELAWH
jgi:hypothetical protein